MTRPLNCSSVSNLLKASPATMPLTPPPGFWRANLRASVTEGGTWARFCHRIQEVDISPTVQDQSNVLHCHARRSRSGSSSRIRCEPSLVKVERHLRVTRFRRWILECIQSPTVPWCEAGPFQCLSLLTTPRSEPNPRRALPVCPNPVVCGATEASSALSALSQQLRPPTLCKSLESSRQLVLVDVASSGRPEQQESRQHEEETPPSLTPG